MKIPESFPSFPFFYLLLHWVRQPFLGIPPFISDPGGLCLFLYLDNYIRHMMKFNFVKGINVSRIKIYEINLFVILLVQ